jgi:hypothetical protein
VGVVVGEGAETVEFFLSGGVPEGELDVDAIDEDICPGIISKLFSDCRN